MGNRTFFRFSLYREELPHFAPLRELRGAGCLRVADLVLYGTGEGEQDVRTHLRLQECVPVPFMIERRVLVPLAVGSHPFPSRTRQLSPPAPMVVVLVAARVGRCQNPAFVRPST